MAATALPGMPMAGQAGAATWHGHSVRVPIEQIADLVGHRTTIVTQKVYRHQLKPVISTGATAMNCGVAPTAA